MARIGAGFAALAGLALLGGCGSDASIEHTNATQTEQLNQIAHNTSELDGADTTNNGSAAAIAAQSTRPAKPRKY